MEKLIQQTTLYVNHFLIFPVKNLMKIFLILMFLFFTSVFSVTGQNNQQSVLEKRAADVVTIINAPTDLEKVLAPSFLAAVAPDKFAEISKSFTAQYGKALKVVKITPKNEFAADIEILFEKDTIGKGVIVLETNAPNLIGGLRFTAFEKTSATLEEIVAEMKKLPGQTGFAAVKLGGENFTPIVSHNADKPFAIGSTFKLYILAELVRSIEAGERKWSDVVELSEKSLPSGQMQNWQKGSPVTLHTLAAMMISISDNTATDQLIETLGRDKIEKMLTITGNENPKLSIPFLKTVEMFKIKGAVKENYAKNYLEKDVSGRRAMLGKEIAEFDSSRIDPNFLSKPNNISNIEWFAAPNDLARLMNWLKRHTEKSPADLGRGVLAINDALTETDANDWKYVGYKGGSETGVINMTYLLQSKKGDWFAVSGSWNDENAAVNETEFVGLMQKAVRLLKEKIK